MSRAIHLGFEVGTGEPVSVPLLNLAVTGQTQQSGKTTALEALAVRSNAKVVTFVTKRGEISFAGGARVRPYFRDRADWQFVDAIMEAALGEKNKFLRQFLIPICRRTQTLGEVQSAVRAQLAKAKGVKEGALIQLDAYLDLIVPDIARARLARSLDLANGLNVVDVSEFSTPMQMLFVQSAIDWVNERERDTIVVIPEAWEFIPEGKGSPVKAAAIALARKGSALGNHIWVDSQDMAGVDKTILRGCTVWLVGVQREANEIKRNLANIPAPIGKPKASDVALLERGQFFVCHGKTLVKVYVQPAWMNEATAESVAMREIPVADVTAPPWKGGACVIRDGEPMPALKEEDKQVNEKEAEALRARNAELERQVADLTARIESLTMATKGDDVISVRQPNAGAESIPSMDAIYAEVKRRAQSDVGLLRILASKPEIEIAVTRKTVQMDAETWRGRIAKLLAQGFYDAGNTNGGTRTELRRTGPDVNNPSIEKFLDQLVADGFLTRNGKSYVAVPGMKVNVVEA